MNDLRSPQEDRPYRPATRNASRPPVPEQNVENYTDVYAGNYQEYSVYERIRYSRWFPLASVLAAVLLFSVIISYAYKEGTHTGVSATTPVIQADNTNYKEKPANPGGMDVPFQDAVVFDNLQSKDGTQNGDSVESLLPPPEQALADAPGTTPAPVVAPPVEAAVSTATPPASNAGTVAAAITASEPQNDVAPVAVAAPVKTEASPVVKKATVVVAKVEKPVTAPALIAVVSGTYRVQLGAFRDEVAARAAWARMRGQYPQLAGINPQFARADLGEKGVFYRVQGGNLSKISAEDLCRGITAKGGNCIVQK